MKRNSQVTKMILSVLLIASLAVPVYSLAKAKARPQ